MGRDQELYFWRDSKGMEIDLLVKDGEATTAYEVKSGATFSADYFKNISKWADLAGASADGLNVVYGGKKSLQTSKGRLIAWRDL